MTVENPEAAELACEAASARAATNPEAAIAELERLLADLTRVRSWDTRCHRALTLQALGRVHGNIRRRPADALPSLQKANELFRELCADGEGDTNNLGGAFGDLANALVDLGRFNEAMKAAEEGLTLAQERNDISAVARAECRTAQILEAMGQVKRAEQRYLQAETHAQAAGDHELDGIIYQSWGNLALNCDHLADAAKLLSEAVHAFERAGDEEGLMQVLNSLGVIERRRGNRKAASAWLERSLELAQRLGHIEGLGQARTSRAILFVEEAQSADEADARRHLLNQAIAEARESLELDQQLGQPASIAISHHNLACVLFAQCGTEPETPTGAGHGQSAAAALLLEAEDHARQAVAIREQLNDWRQADTLDVLSDIAAVRGDDVAAAEYKRRADAARSEGRN